MTRTMKEKRRLYQLRQRKRKWKDDEPSDARPQKRRRVNAKNSGDGGTEEFEIEKLVGFRRRNGREEYKVVWIGYPGEDTWEPSTNLPPKLVQSFNQRTTRSARAVQSQVQSCMICHLKPTRSSFQCNSCENWYHRYCAGVRRVGKNDALFCPTCAKKRDGEEHIPTVDQKPSRANFVSKRTRRPQEKASSEPVESSSDMDIDDCKEPSEDAEADSSDSAFDFDIDVKEDSDDSDVQISLPSDCEGSSLRVTRSKKSIPKVNPLKMELDSSSESEYAEDHDDSESDIEILNSKRNNSSRRFGSQGLDPIWLESLTWNDIENTDRDHGDLNLSSCENYTVLIGTGEVDQRNCPIFKYKPDPNLDGRRIHVWRSEPKSKAELKRDEPLGNFRADYNRGEKAAACPLLGGSTDGSYYRVQVRVVSPIRFDVDGKPCVHVEGDWNFLESTQGRISRAENCLPGAEERLAALQAELKKTESRPHFPFKRRKNPHYDAASSKAWLKRSRYWHMRNEPKPSYVEKWMPNHHYDAWKREADAVRKQKKRVQDLKNEISGGCRRLDWCQVTSNLDRWLPTVSERYQRNKRADFHDYFYSHAIREHAISARQSDLGFDYGRQERLEILSRGTNRITKERLQLIASEEDEAEESFLKSEVRLNMADFLFVDKIHHASKSIKEIMNEILPEVPDVLVDLIAAMADDMLYVKDIEINPDVLLEKLQSDQFLEDNAFLLPYILQTNCPASGSTLPDIRERLFYHQSNVPLVAVNLMENLTEEDLSETRRIDLREIISKPYHYQLRSYVWMEDLEQKVLRKHRYIFGANDLYIDRQAVTFDGDSTNFPLIFDHVNQSVGIYSENSAEFPERFISTSGGVLADEVGLGKTLTMICLLCGNRPTLKVMHSLKCLQTTLVVAPSHLLHQWKDEIEKHSKHKWNIIEVATKLHYEKVTPDRLYSADILLVSIQFLKGPWYKSHRFQDKPWLETMKFWRVIVDEGHELVEKSNRVAMSTLLNINGVNYWYLSGTPFPSPKALAFCCQFIRLRVCDRPVDETEFLLRTPVGHVLERLLVDHIVMRNTKVSVDELYIPKRVEIPAFIHLHPVERGLYEICHDLNPKDARQLCSDIKSVESYRIIFNGLDSFPNSLANYRTVQRVEQHAEMKDLEHTLETERRKRRPDIVWIRMLERDLAGHKKFLERIDREIAFCRGKELEKAMERWDLKNRNNPLRRATYFLGSKFAAAILWIVRLVQSDPGARIICFSNFNSVLQNYHSYLTNNGVKSVFCMGNVFVRRNAIRSFQSEDPDPVRVMLLSIQESASGTNLTRATHVCLLDPVAASASQAVAAEEQAVGRALRQGMSREQRCQIIRFVAEDTIEQELFERNQEQRQQNEGSE